MSNYLSELPIELIEKILDHTSIFDILSSVCLVNKRLYSISLAYSRFRLDFNVIGQKKKNFDFICDGFSNLAPRIVSLTFDEVPNIITNAKIMRFFHSIAINKTFSNLHSITFYTMDSNAWNLIRTRLISFVSLTSMSIISIHDSKKPTLALISLIFHDLLFTVQSLKHLSLSTSFCPLETITIAPSFPMQTSSIECLTLTGVNIELHRLFAVAPMLRQINAELSQLFPGDIACLTLIHLRQLSINTNRLTMLEIRRLLSPMICLSRLTFRIANVDRETDLTNGHAWIPLLSKIVVFQFLFKFSNQDYIGLDSFRTSFWLEEKKWYVTYDHWINTSTSFLYTNPCCAGCCPPLSFMQTAIVSESTGSGPKIFPHAQRLSYDSRLPMQKSLLSRFTHARALSVDGNPTISLEYITTCLDLSRITSFSCGEAKPDELSNGFVQVLHNLPWLRSLCLPVSVLVLLFDHHWPQIVRLNVKNGSSFHSSDPLSSAETDALWLSFNRLNGLGFCRQSVRHLERLFNNRTMTLSNVWIRHYGDLHDFNPRLITHEWLQQNTKLPHFDYFNDNSQDVHLWL